MKNIKKIHKIGLAIIFIIIISGILCIQFTSFGYKMTVPVWGYTEVQDNIFVDKSYSGDMLDILTIIDEANMRLELFWGSRKSKPQLIISDNEKHLTKLGWTGNPALTTTNVFFGAHSYIVISPKGLNIDVIAHELTHAELHSRLFDRKILPEVLIPTWFDEGIATQSDYRDKYNYDTWVEVTKNGENITDFLELKAPSQFYNSDINIRRYNYIISKHEVKDWISNHSVDSLIDLIEGVNKGKSFEELYANPE